MLHRAGVHFWNDLEEPRGDVALVRKTFRKSTNPKHFGDVFRTTAFLVFDLLGGNTSLEIKRNARRFIHPELNDGKEAAGLIV